MKDSKAAVAVAQEVISTVGKGGIPRMKEIQEKHGYSPASARSSKAVETDSYKRTMQPFVQRLEKERERIIGAMESKNLDEEDYKVLSDSLAKLTHDVQLLSGGKTENIGIDEDRKKILAVLAEIRG